MTKRLAFTVFLVACVQLSACMISPSDGKDIPSRTTKVDFSGYVNTPNQPIELQIYEVAQNTWETFGTTTSAASGHTDAAGAMWYAWHSYEYLPRHYRFWPANQSGMGTVRAVGESELATATQSGWDCVFAAFLDMGHVEAYSSCVGGATYEAALLGEDDVAGLDGSYDVAGTYNLADWPSAKGFGFAKTAQGVTHSDTHWYFSSTENEGRLARLVKGASLPSWPHAAFDAFANYDHPGDMDYFDGWLYIALEEGQGGRRNGIGIVSTSNFSSSSEEVFQFAAGTPQATGGTMPWIARDPITGYFYSSAFNGNKLYRYKASYNSSGKPTGFQYCGYALMDRSLSRVQGGDFSPSGRLYLATDAQSTSAVNEGLIKVVEMNGHLTGYEPISCSSPPSTRVEIIDDIYIPRTTGFCFPLVDDPAEEIEGITFWDLDDGSAYGGRLLGQLHTILVDCDPASSWDFYLKHTRLYDHW